MPNPNAEPGSDAISYAVEFVGAHPGMSDRILLEHAREDSGHCRRCRYNLRPERWPCTTARIALLARGSSAGIRHEHLSEDES